MRRVYSLNGNNDLMFFEWGYVCSLVLGYLISINEVLDLSISIEGVKDN